MTKANWTGLSKSIEEWWKNWMSYWKITRFHTLSNVKHIKCVEAKLTKVRQDMETPEHKKRSYDNIFKGIHKQRINKRRKKENRRKLNERKRMQTGNNVQRVHGLCVGNPLGNLPQFIVHPPSLAVPETCVKVEDVATSLFRRDRLYIVQLLEENYFTSAARKRITTNPLSKKPETMFTPSCTLKSTLWLKALVTSAQEAGKELNDREDEDECQWKLYN